MPEDNSEQTPPADPRQTPQHIDFLRLAWERKTLLIVGLMIGLVLGYLNYLHSPEIFRSSARVQINESSSRNMPVQGIETSRSERLMTDETLVIRSERILSDAVERGRLDELPPFAGFSPAEIAANLAGSVSLEVGPAVERSNSIFLIAFSCTDPESSQRVVQAITGAYAAHLRQQYLDVGRETLSLIQEARGDVSKRLSALEENFDEFKQSSKLVYEDGETRSIHREQADKLAAQLYDLHGQKLRLESELRAAGAAIEKGNPSESVLIALGESASGRTVPSGGVTMQEAIDAELELACLQASAQPSPSETLLESQLIPLEMEKKELEFIVASGHPSVNSIQKRIQVLRQRIEELAESEAEYAMQLKEAMLAVESTRIEGEEVDREASMSQLLNIKMAAHKQRLQSVQHELAVISESYKHESQAARQESSLEMKAERFQREIGRQQELYDRIVERLDEVTIMADNARLKIFPLDQPKLGTKTAPSVYKSLIMGGFLGVLAAGGLAYVREITDKSYHSAEQIASHLKVPVIGHIPMIGIREEQPDESPLNPVLCTYHESGSSRSEAFKSIRTALYFSNQASGQQVIQITSPAPGEGKSTVAANVAIAIAQSGKRVLLMDADLRCPRIHTLFGIESKGLGWLIGEVSDAQPDQEVHDLTRRVISRSPVPNLSVMVAGDVPSNPSELLSSPQFDRVINVLRGHFDAIIIDSPPLLAVTDPSNVAARVDGVIMVLRLGKNTKPLAADATRIMETLNTQLIGVVVNGIGSRQAKDYGKREWTDADPKQGRFRTYAYGYKYGGNGAYGEYYK